MKFALFIAAAAVVAFAGPSLAKNRFISDYTEARIQQLVPGADTTNVTGGQSFIIDQIFIGGPGGEYNTDLDRRNALRILLKKVPGGLPENASGRVPARK